MCLVVAFAPPAAADESHADCEAGQPWIGYRSTDPARAIVRPALAQQGLAADACEGEQWDGQDAVAGGQTTALAMGTDPNSAPGEDPFAPVGVRVTQRATEIYVAYNVGFVARGAVYVGTCGAGEPGLEGEASCAGTRALRTGVYVRDNTPGNIVMTTLCLRFHHCYVPESDCSQAIYQQGAYDPPPVCGRDNTAFGIDLVYLP